MRPFYMTADDEARQRAWKRRQWWRQKHGWHWTFILVSGLVVLFLTNHLYTLRAVKLSPPAETSIFVEMPLKDGSYPLMEVPNADLVREYMRAHPDMELVAAGTLYGVIIKDG